MYAAVLRRRVLQSSSVHYQFARCYAAKSFPPHTVVTMPALSPTMTAGNIGAWHKKPGDTVSPGDVLVEIETDKAQMDFEFQEEGVLAKVLKESGEKDVAVGNVRFARNFRISHDADINSPLPLWSRKEKILLHSNPSHLKMLEERNQPLHHLRKKPVNLLNPLTAAPKQLQSIPRDPKSRNQSPKSLNQVVVS